MANKSLEKIAITFSITCACIIIMMKFWGWISTNSTAMLASLFDSVLDLISSIVNMLALIFSSKPADEKHRFGHDKIEDLAVFSQSAFFGVSGIFVLGNGVFDLFELKTVNYTTESLWVVTFSIVLITILMIVQSYVYKKTKSIIVHADQLHYFIDLMINIGVIVSIYLSSSYNLPIIDAVFAILLAILMIKSACKLAVKAFSNLVDSEFEDEKKQIIIDLVKTYPEILGMHDIKTRQAASKIFIQFHVEFDPEIKLKHSHEVTENITKKLREKFQNAEIIIHQDPFGIDEHVEYPFKYN